MKFFNRNLNLCFSKIPIYSDNSGNIKALVLKDAIFKETVLDNGYKTLIDLKRNIIVVHQSLPITQLFKKLVESKNPSE